MTRIIASHYFGIACATLSLSFSACTSFDDGELGIFESRSVLEIDDAGASRAAPESSGFTIMLTASTDAVCPGECVELTAAASGGREPYQYNWELPGLAGAGPHRVCPATRTTYRAFAIDADFQQSGHEVTAEVEIAVRARCETPPAPATTDAGTPPSAAGSPAPPMPAPEQLAISLTASQTAICPGDCLELTATASGGHAPYQYDWGVDGFTGPGPQHVCPQEAREFSATVIDADFETSRMEYGAHVQIALRTDCRDAPATGPLALRLTANATKICLGECVELTAAASGGNPPYAYTWDTESFEGPGPQRVCPMRSTTYRAFVTDGDFATKGIEVGDSATVTVDATCAH